MFLKLLLLTFVLSANQDNFRSLILTTDNFDRVRKTTNLIILFWVVKCPVCESQGKKLNEIMDQFKTPAMDQLNLTFANVNCENYGDFCKKRLQIHYFPQLILFPKGKMMKHKYEKPIVFNGIFRWVEQNVVVEPVQQNRDLRILRSRNKSEQGEQREQQKEKQKEKPKEVEKQISLNEHLQTVQQKQEELAKLKERHQQQLNDKMQQERKNQKKIERKQMELSDKYQELVDGIQEDLKTQKESLKQKVDLLKSKNQSAYKEKQLFSFKFQIIIFFVSSVLGLFFTLVYIKVSRIIKRKNAAKST